MSSEDFRNDVAQKSRFAFGKNWQKFLARLSADKIREAEASLKARLELDSLSGKTFLDIGSGSGLFSLAARNLGATVVSFDYDDESVQCAHELKSRFHKNCPSWQIMQGSVLDRDFLSPLGTFDIVYSWGVLHHTGDMWQSLDNATINSAKGGILFISIYNDQGRTSRYWACVKKAYNRLPASRPFWFLLHLVYPQGPYILLNKLRGRTPPRGMSIWTDYVDWLGGYPFEVATPEEIFNFCKARGFILSQIKTVGGRSGCNEFVFRRQDG